MYCVVESTTPENAPWKTYVDCFKTQFLKLFSTKSLISKRSLSTGCNKTYYGDIGRTYELELHRPREDLVPYVCLLTITAAGGIHGDLVQVSDL